MAAEDACGLPDDARSTTPVAASVVMPSRDKAPYLDLTLASYAGQSRRDYELLLVDDGSSDDTALVAARWRDRVPLEYVRSAPRGRAAARNLALARARGDTVIFSDDDRLVGPDFVASHLAAHAEPSDEPLLVLGWMSAVVTVLAPGMLGPLTEVLGRRLAPGAPGDPSRPRLLVRPEDLRERFAGTVAELAVPEPDWERKVAPVIASHGESLAGLELGWFLGSTGNLSAPRALVSAAGGLDEGFVGYGMEDTDLCYALVRAGGKCVLSRAAVNYHQLHPKMAERELASSMRYFLDKHASLEAYLFAHWFFGGIGLGNADRLLAEARRGVAQGAVLPGAFAALLQAQIDARLGR